MRVPLYYTVKIRPYKVDRFDWFRVRITANISSDVGIVDEIFSNNFKLPRITRTKTPDMLSELSLLLLLILRLSVCESKPIDVNEVDTGTQRDHKDVGDEIDVTEIGEVPRPLLKFSNEQTTSSTKRISTVTSMNTSEKITSDEIESEKFLNPQNTTVDNNSATRQQGFAWFLTPFTQKVQFSPQTFIEDRIGQLKNTLNHFGSLFPNQQDGGSKQLANAGGLVNLVGLNDSGFYTNRLDPVGFFGGNGWFANKGGILGGPGALISTGSLFTDYSTPYKK